ncbi:hypothetical protein [Bacillus sp. Marseille-Q3570]|uniref:hypothetical protein n=1 Tax=Bacillus sp. Marseille-Q3570 TaxID=2963522 RepID=UPI0021B7725F|nr:hypothetical protein [Bacillus sp. Marseille-Q3570]
MSKKNRSKRTTEQGAERVQGNDAHEINTTMSEEDRTRQKKRSEYFSTGGE